MIGSRHMGKAAALALTMAALISLGCASVQQKKISALPISYAPEAGPAERYWPDPALKDAFEEYWATRFAGQWEGAWKMEAPYFQEMASKRRYGILLKNSDKKKVLDIRLCKAIDRKCRLYEIPVEFSFSITEGKTEEVHVMDRWVQVSGKWHHVMRDPVFFPGL